MTALALLLPDDRLEETRAAEQPSRQRRSTEALCYTRSTCVLVVVGEGGLRRCTAKLLGATYPRGMNVRGVDERTSRWESDDPTFRVYLFSGGGSGRSWTTGTYDITGADGVQVLGWAQSK